MMGELFSRCSTKNASANAGAFLLRDTPPILASSIVSCDYGPHMISIEHGEYRFFSGDNVEYRNSDPNYLFEQAATATSADMRRYAAAGIVRGLMNVRPEERAGQDYFDAINWGVRVILDVLRDSPVDEPSEATQSVLDDLAPVNGVLDTTSIKATETALRADNSLLTRTAIERRSPPDRPKLFVALGHGGIVSSLATYSQFPEGSLVYPVRFSRHKAHDATPAVSDDEMQLLQDFANGRDLIVHDEDRNFGETMDNAVKYFMKEISPTVYGVTPTHGRHPSAYSPQIFWYDETGRKNDTYSSWSEKMIQLKAEAGLAAKIPNIT